MRDIMNAIFVGLTNVDSPDLLRSNVEEGRVKGRKTDQEASLTKCLFQIHPTKLSLSSWFLASQSSPFSPMTSKI